MDFAHLFLSFQGRTRRSHFWIGLILLWIVESIIWSFSFGSVMTSAALRGNPFAIANAMSGMGLIGGLFFLALLWPSLAIQVKRWHDRDKSGWMVLINLIPIVGFFWTFIECGGGGGGGGDFLDGTQGPNKFGPSPKGLGGVRSGRRLRLEGGNFSRMLSSLSSSVPHLRWSVHQQILALLIQWEGDDFADGLLAGEKHHYAVYPGCQPAVRGRAIPEGAQHAAKFRLHDRGAVAGDFEGLQHHLGRWLRTGASSRVRSRCRRCRTRQARTSAGDPVSVAPPARPAAWRRDCARNRHDWSRR